jgi:hypothetical protein
MVEAKQQLTAQQRAGLFMTATRQTIQGMPSEIVQGENTTVQFQLPKARLLSKIYLEVDAVVTLKGTAPANAVRDAFSPYKILRRVSLDLNNGFSPFIIPGRDLSIYNMDRLNPGVLLPDLSGSFKSINEVENGVTAAGKDNRIKFMVELPLTMNDRDPVGLVMLQNAETSVTLTVDIATLSQAYALNAGNAETAVFKSMVITPVLETYTIPPDGNAVPDLSVLKLVSSKVDQFAGNGQAITKLQVGTIYRKLFFFFQDAAGLPLKDSDFQGNLELVFNQADIPYSIKPSILSARNHSQLGYCLPEGVYLFDFSYQGIPNMGGSRDYIDTERLTEFWVRYSTTKAGQVSTITETLSRLR